MTVVIVLISCKEQNQSVQKDKISYEQIVANEISSFENSRIKDSLRIDKIERLQHEAEMLRRNGVFGKWKTSHQGFETTIFIKKIESQYQAITHFDNSKQKPTKQWLRKVNNKYYIIGTKVNEHYIINSKRNLEIHDNQGLFTTGYNIFPGEKVTEKPKFNLNDVVGKDIFYIAGNYSQSSPVTLEGTDSAIWIVYYSDLDVTFRVNKKTQEIVKAGSGSIRNLK